MKKTNKNLLSITFIGLFAITNLGLFAGNKDRSGQAGAQHLLIDPWARSSGWGTAGVAEIRGLESVYSNIAGLAFVDRTEAGFSNLQYLAGSGTGIQLNSFGVAQAIKVRDKSNADVRLRDRAVIKDFGVLGIFVTAMSFGDIPITTVDQPEGNLGTFSPNMTYIGVSYAKSFNDFIHGGVAFKIINESIANLNSIGLGIDFGIQYLAGKYKNFKIGMTLKNIGIPMKYNGDGYAVRGIVTGDDKEVTLQQRPASAELPSLLTLGLSYDFCIFEKDAEKDLMTRDSALHRITLAGSFTANSFSKDIFSLGVEYGFSRFFMVRAGYSFEPGIFKYDTRSTWYTGPSLGATVGIPLGKGKDVSRILLDYSYRFTQRWKGSHSVGIKLQL